MAASGLTPAGTAERERRAAILGTSLAVAFGTCFLTGLLSHLAQNPLGWLRYPTEPASLYRWTQGVHVATGIAAIPLLLAKLFTVYPRLWRRPPVRGAAEALERLALVPLVGGSLLQLTSGVQNIFYWYAWQFFFTTTHYWTAWIVMGALAIHVGAKLPIAGPALRRRRPEAPAAPAPDPARRRFLLTVASAAGVLTLTTIGAAVTPLGKLAVLAARRPDSGPQGLPVNRNARSAMVLDRARDPGWRLRVTGAVARPLSLSLEELRARAGHQAVLPIACVEGWSKSAHWRGVRLRDLLAEAGAAGGRTVLVRSFAASPYAQSRLQPGHSGHPDTLLALDLNGEPLDLDHGFPVRLIAPSLPGVMQTKWLMEVRVE